MKPKVIFFINSIKQARCVRRVQEFIEAGYPTEIYARFIRFIITWIIPFAFVAYLPASYFLGVRGTFGLNEGVGIIGIECIIVAVFWVVAYAVFNRETKKLLFH